MNLRDHINFIAEESSRISQRLFDRFTIRLCICCDDLIDTGPGSRQFNDELNAQSSACDARFPAENGGIGRDFWELTHMMVSPKTHYGSSRRGGASQVIRQELSGVTSGGGGDVFGGSLGDDGSAAVAAFGA